MRHTLKEVAKYNNLCPVKFKRFLIEHSNILPVARYFWCSEDCISEYPDLLKDFETSTAFSDDLVDAYKEWLKSK